MIDYKLEKANPSHADIIFSFIKRYFPYYKTSRDEVMEHIQAGNHLYILAVVKNKVVGFIDVELKKNAFILGLAVSEEFRNNGIGTALLKSTIDQLQDKNTYLLVEITNITAIQLYLNNGFVVKQISRIPVAGKPAYLMVYNKSY